MGVIFFSSTISLWLSCFFLSYLTFCRSIPVKRGLFAAVEGVLQLFDQVGLSREPKQTFLLEAPLPDEVHALLDKHGGELVPEAALIPDRLLQLLPEDP